MDEHKSDLRIAEQRLALVGERIESRYSLPGYYKAFVDLQDLAAAQLGEVMNYDLYDTYSTLLKLRESLLRPSEQE